MFTDITRFIHT